MLVLCYAEGIMWLKLVDLLQDVGAPAAILVALVIAALLGYWTAMLRAILKEIRESKVQAQEDRKVAERRAQEDREANRVDLDRLFKAVERRAQEDREAAERRAQEDREANKVELDRLFKAAERRAQEDREAAERRAQEDREANKADLDRLFKAAERRTQEGHRAAEERAREDREANKADHDRLFELVSGLQGDVKVLLDRSDRPSNES